MTARLYFSSPAEAAGIKLGHSWTDEDGKHFASIDLGDCHMALRTTDEADALIKAATDAKDALLRLAAETTENGTAAGTAGEGGTE